MLSVRMRVPLEVVSDSQGIETDAFYNVPIANSEEPVIPHI
jgi:hypothetical protein